MLNKRSYTVYFSTMLTAKYRSCAFCALLLFVITSCKEKHELPAVEEAYKPQITPAKASTSRDTILVGMLGEETAMSNLQLITFEGDTFSICRTDPSATKGIMLGDVRNYSDRIMVSVTIKAEDELYLKTFLNISQMEGLWKNSESSIDLRSDSTVAANGYNYTHWSVNNCKLLLVGEQKREYATTQHTDTATITYLDADSLFLNVPRHGLIKFGNK